MSSKMNFAIKNSYNTFLCMNSNVVKGTLNMSQISSTVNRFDAEKSTIYD